MQEARAAAESAAAALLKYPENLTLQKYAEQAETAANAAALLLEEAKTKLYDGIEHMLID